VKVVSIVGARPQFIKAAVLSPALRREHHEVLVHTGQHYDEPMSQAFFQELGLPEPDYHLGVGSGSHGEQTGRMLERIEDVLLREKPDYALVYGDTNSTLAGALAAAKLGVRLGHVEAGLRSGNRRLPEEINRIVADHCSDLLFCPTMTAVNNLEREGITAGVHPVGDVMCDSLLQHLPVAEEKSNVLERLGVSAGAYYLATIHRAANTDDAARLADILEGLQRGGPSRLRNRSPAATAPPAGLVTDTSLSRLHALPPRQPHQAVSGRKRPRKRPRATTWPRKSRNC
jgi:UDP-N-acetylglucosamine 2-epimerase